MPCWYQQRVAACVGTSASQTKSKQQCRSPRGLAEVISVRLCLPLLLSGEEKRYASVHMKTLEDVQLRGEEGALKRGAKPVIRVCAQAANALGLPFHVRYATQVPPSRGIHREKPHTRASLSPISAPSDVTLANAKWRIRYQTVAVPPCCLVKVGNATAAKMSCSPFIGASARCWSTALPTR